MAYAYPAQYIGTDEVIDPRDLMNNVNQLAGEINGHLDRDNAQLVILTVTKWPSETFISTGSNPVGGEGGASLQTIDAGQTGIWTTITDLTTSVTTSDGAIKVSADVEGLWTSTANIYNDKCEIRLLINGIERARSGWVHSARTWFGVSISGYVPCVEGTTTILVQIRAYSALYRLVDDMRNGEDPATIGLNNPAQTSSGIYIEAGNVVWEHRKR